MPGCRITLQTTVYVRACSTVIQTIGLLLSLFRLGFRYRIRRLWWEDAYAFFAFLFALAYLIGIWLYTEGENLALIVGLWMHTFPFTMVVWLVRLSIFLSVTRIIYPTLVQRRVMIVLALLFSALFLCFFSLKLWFYTRDLHWMYQLQLHGKEFHRLSKELIIFELTTDFITPKQRRMIILTFASGFVVTVVGIFRAILQLTKSTCVVVAMDVEIGFSMIMCNLLVFVTFLYRYRRAATPSPSPPSRNDPNYDDDYTTPVRRTPSLQQLTTVELGTGYFSHENLSSQRRPGSQSAISSHPCEPSGSDSELDK